MDGADNYDIYDDEGHEGEDDGEFDFDCPAYYPPGSKAIYCPLQGSEDCEWECPYGHYR